MILKITYYIIISVINKISQVEFEAHQKKMGDEDFQYDVEVDFETGAIETCEWDDEDDIEF